MLNIESELRSLRSELEDRNKILPHLAISSRPVKTNNLNKCETKLRESIEVGSIRRNSGDNETEKELPEKNNKSMETTTLVSPGLNKMVSVYRYLENN